MQALLEQIYRIGILPVIKINNPDDAVPLARALEAGGIPAAEVTFRTAHAEEAIRRITAEVPGVLTGAGTVLTADQADRAVGAGAQFIVTPGFNPRVVDHCLERRIPVFPGAPSPSDIEQAIERGLKVVKCFPAEALGGLPYLKAISGPYSGIRFMPTGGIGPANINAYLGFDRVLACGGSWMIDQKRIEAGDFEGITRLCREAVDTVLGLKFSHIGINSDDGAQAADTAKALCSLLGTAGRETPSVLWAGDGIEIMKKTGRGSHGHIAVACNSIDRAVYQLGRRGVAFDRAAAGTDSSGRRYIFLQDEIAGFAIHLTERQGESK